MKRPKLKYLRGKKGFTQTEVAKLLGITERQYGRIERGEFSMPIPILLKLKPILGVEYIEHLLEDEELRDS